MVSESGDVTAFLSSHPPLDHLDARQMSAVAEAVTTGFFRAGDVLPAAIADANSNTGMIVLRTGSIEVRATDGELIDRLSSGDYLLPMRLFSIPGEQPVVTVLEDCLFYELPRSLLDTLRAASDDIDRLMDAGRARLRIGAASRRVGSGDQVPCRYHEERVSRYMSPRIVFADGDTSIREAAMTMRDNGISSLLVQRDGELAGIVTDRDFRNRVLSNGVPDDTPVSTVMTASPMCIAPDSPLSEARLTMMSEGIRHLPVVADGETLGMISQSDILRASNSEPLTLVNAIHRSADVDELERLAREIPALVVRLIERDTRAGETGRILTTFTDAMTRRLLSLAERELGDRPGEYCWLAFGSQARQEQVLGSDQDNALLLPDDTAEADMGWFLQMADFVNQGLNRCGLPFCPGDIMARNPKWCMRLGDWKQTFLRWIEEPSPDALMHASIFFDMRHIAGQRSLSVALQRRVLALAQANTIFQAMMNDNAQQHTPPLGFFKTFVLERDGDHNHTLDLKKRGTIPIVDAARNYALSAGIDTVNTLDRLQRLEQAGEMSSGLAESLIDAHEFIASIRLQAQADEIRRGGRPDNHIDPDTLSPLVRHQLKDAFDVVRDAQQAMRARFGAGAI